MYTQNNEEEIILNYFGDKKGHVLDIGANDGKTFSNSLRVIEKGWSAVLIEPAPTAYKRLQKLHGKNKNVTLLNIAIGTENGTATLNESGPLINASDTALVSSIDAGEMKRWEPLKIKFKEVKVEVMDFATLEKLTDNYFDLISIDAEGFDLEILRQVDLTNTAMVIVEFNGKDEAQYISHCAKFGLKEISRNGENLIFAR